MRPRFMASLVFAGVLAASAAFAGHHSWDFTEAFSNGSGSVQFVELHCPVNGEAGLGPFTMTSTTNTLNFVTNLPSTSTADTWVLCATSGFGSIPGGVTPDYVIPANFFPTAGGTLTYAGGADVWNYGAVPTDGVSSLLRGGGTAANTPTNFAGASGSVNFVDQFPGAPAWALGVMMGALLLAGSGLLRRRTA